MALVSQPLPHTPNRPIPAIADPGAPVRPSRPIAPEADPPSARRLVFPETSPKFEVIESAEVIDLTESKPAVIEFTEITEPEPTEAEPESTEHEAEVAEPVLDSNVTLKRVKEEENDGFETPTKIMKRE